MNNTAVKKATDEEIEILLIKNFIDEEVYELSPCLRNISCGQYVDVINNELSATLIKSLCDTSDFHKLIRNALETENAVYNSWLCVGVASLLYFVQFNWTGPEIDEDIEWLKVHRERALNELSLHDECNTNIKKPELLYFSKIIFSSDVLQTACKSCTWWLLRANVLHQFVLNESSGTIFEETEGLIKKIDDLPMLTDPYCKALFNVEVAQFYFYYRRIQNSEKHIEHAQEIAKLNLSLEGAMGKRTKYQYEVKAQLFLKVEVGKDPFPSKYCEDLPKPLDLNDDVRLERIYFLEEKPNVQLGALEEAIVLAKYVQLQLSQPKHKLTDEEIKPYLDAVIDGTNNWSLRMASLYHRCTLESTDKRTIERSMLQMQYLLQELKTAKVPVARRIDMFFASGLKSIYTSEETWAHFMLSLGLAKSALDVFIKLELWEEVIMCYNILDLKHKAAEIIRQQLSEKPTVRLWCLLGDATQDPSHYETAWKLSNERSSRVQRHWGYFYFAHHNYKEAVPHLKLSVELNNIQENVWIRLGFAALQTEDWKLAATAYRSYCALEQSTFEAWNNLAKAYIKLGDKPRAWMSLQDAIKCNYDRWQVWDNLMIVSIDLGHFSEVIRCYHRILDLKNHHLDIQILGILTDAILNDVTDADGNPSRKLLPKVLELFGRITSFMLNSPDIWGMYGQLTALKKTDFDNEKAAQYLQQAHRAAVSKPRWFQKEESTEKVLQLCCLLAETYRDCASSCEVKKKRSLLGSAKLSLQGVVKKVKEQQWVHEKITSDLQKVEDHLNVLTDELETIKLSN